MILCAAVVGTGLSLAMLQEPAPPPEPDESTASAQDTAPTVDLDGTMVPADVATIALWMKRYREELLVLEAAPHGSFVNEGDVLIRFDTSRIDEQLHQAEFDLAQAEEKLVRTEQEAGIKEEAAEAEIVRAERESDWAGRRLAGYLEHERGFVEEGIRLQNQSSQHNVEDQHDELEQLERMYREDELVDATEEIVLKRSRRSLASTIARASLREQQNHYTLEAPEAIKLEGLQLEAEQRGANLDRRHRSVDIERASREAGLQKARFDLQKQLDRLEQLKSDRELLTVRAPRGGLVMHGDAEAAPGTAILKRGNRAGLFKTIMTVADPDRLKIVTSVPESSLPIAGKGQAVTVTVAAVADLELVGRLKVSYLPTARSGSGENLYRAEVELDRSDPRLRPGMQCTVSIAAPESSGAVQVSGRSAR
jgi:multidrug efflux pump subunit AcrA (membrane-fusion protein)